MSGRNFAKDSAVDELTARQRQVLDQLNRAPGATIQEMADHLGLSHTASAYNLRGLERKGLIVSRRHGRTVRHFPAGRSASGLDWLSPILRDPQRSRVVDDLRKDAHLDVSINELARRLGLGFSIVKSTLSELERRGLLQIQQVHGRFRIRRTLAFEASLPTLEAQAAALPLGTPGELDATLERPVPPEGPQETPPAVQASAPLP